MAPPLRNKNAFRHGLRTVGMLPKDCSWVRKSLAAFRNLLEVAVIDAHGKIGL